MLAIAAAPPMLALETKAVADARRLRAAFAALGANLAPAFRRLGEVVTTLAHTFAELGRALVRGLTTTNRPGYYVRDGKLRRNHGYFKRRAKARRAMLKAAR